MKVELVLVHLVHLLYFIILSFVVMLVYIPSMMRYKCFKFIRFFSIGCFLNLLYHVTF
ncbi:hypothetical protein DFH28DRAFT_993882 [Melampsora americana]|nr:hypothetical protein DFH28DRAFT_993882 [Melampsora americana]